MADLSAAADPGSGHLLGHVLGDGQAVSMAAHHVSIPSVYVEVFAFHLVLRLFKKKKKSHWPLLGSHSADRQSTSQPLWLHIGHSINGTTVVLHLQIALIMASALFLSSVTYRFTSTYN